MHAVNNGPVYKFTADRRITNKDAGLVGKEVFMAESYSTILDVTLLEHTL